MNFNLISLNFKYEEFPDGWFWYLAPDDIAGKFALAAALGECVFSAEDLPDPLILQVDSSLKHWSFVCGCNLGDLEEAEVTKILERLKAKSEKGENRHE